MNQKHLMENAGHAPSLMACDPHTQRWSMSAEETTALTRTLLKGFGYAFGSALFAVGMYQSYGNVGLGITAGFGVVGLAVKGVIALANRKKTPAQNCG